jgi:hypothetical protein
MPFSFDEIFATKVPRNISDPIVQRSKYLIIKARTLLPIKLPRALEK